MGHWREAWSAAGVGVIARPRTCMTGLDEIGGPGIGKLFFGGGGPGARKCDTSARDVDGIKLGGRLEKKGATARVSVKAGSCCVFFFRSCAPSLPAGGISGEVSLTTVRPTRVLFFPFRS